MLTRMALAEAVMRDALGAAVDIATREQGFIPARDVSPLFARLEDKVMRDVARKERRERAVKGWPNWYINRGRMSLSPSKRELRQVSWRRAF
jgi:hypothetical protein